MAKKTANDHADDHEAAHKHEGSSIGFYIFIALVLGAITYVEFALVEYQTTWFSALSSGAILFWLIALSVVKFIMVVMFFMHLQQDDRTFTGFFTSGMVIAVGTLFALSALFTVRSLGVAQTPQEEIAKVRQEGLPEAGDDEGHAEAAEGHAEETLVPSSLTHRFEYPTPKVLNEDIINLTPPGQIIAGGSVQDSGGYPVMQDAATAGGSIFEVLRESSESGQIAGGIPLASPPPPITLPDPFAQQPAQPPAQQGQPGQEAVQAAGAQGGDESSGGDPAAGEALFVGALGCAGCHGQDGGGGIGPNLTDAEWIYGGDAASISETLHNGRPGGMPAFGGQASEEEIVDLVAYVQSLGGQGASGE
jgi:mono/diheme cytochrome c family protein/heme/copper-type cytochrome/quinol oxidase subunit 4